MGPKKFGKIVAAQCKIDKREIEQSRGRINDHNQVGGQEPRTPQEIAALPLGCFGIDINVESIGSSSYGTHGASLLKLLAYHVESQEDRFTLGAVTRCLL